MVDRADGLKNYMPGAPREWVERLIDSDDDTDHLLENNIRTIHAPIVFASAYTPTPGFGPVPLVIGNTMTLNFDDPLNDVAFRMFKIPTNFLGNASFHIHWTKSSGTAEPGNPSVQWQINYSIYDGNSESIFSGSNNVDVGDTYNDPAAASRVVYRTEDIPINDLTAGYYVGVNVRVLTNNMAVSTPVLVSLDIIWDQTIHNI